MVSIFTKSTLGSTLIMMAGNNDAISLRGSRSMVNVALARAPNGSPPNVSELKFPHS